MRIKFLVVAICNLIFISCTKEIEFSAPDTNIKDSIVYYLPNYYEQSESLCIYNNLKIILHYHEYYNSSIVWSTGDTVRDLIVNFPGEYTLTIDSSYKNTYYCVPCEFELIIPDAFTPNSDSYNDLLYIRGIENTTNLEGEIHNDKGVKVYSFNFPYISWNGTDDNGNRLLAGNYFYNIKCKFIDGSIKKYKGVVKLILE